MDDDDSPGDALDAVRRRYDRLAAEYERRWSFYIEASLRETLARIAPVAPGTRILDVACGTGALLRALWEEEPGVRLAGLDVSPEMLAVARETLGGDGTLAVARAEELPYPDGAFDLVVSTNAFHFVRGPRRALGEWHRVLAEGGRLVLTDWCDDYLACKVCDRILRLVDPAHFRTYGREALGELLEEAGYAGVEVERYKISWLWGLMTARGRIA